MTDTDMLYMAGLQKQLDDTHEENRVLMKEADRLIKEKGKLMAQNEELKQLLCKTLPVLHAAIFVNYKETRKADELYDEIVKIVGKGGDTNG